jgi:hypothetical protein
VNRLKPIERHWQLDIHQDNKNMKGNAVFVINSPQHFFSIARKFHPK